MYYATPTVIVVSFCGPVSRSLQAARHQLAVFLTPLQRIVVVMQDLQGIRVATAPMDSP